jgi:ferredoxin-NADP reductase
LTAAASPRDVWWIYGARDRDDHSFAAEARALLAAIPASHSHIRYSSPGPGDRLAVDFDAPGRLSVDVLRDLGVPLDADFYLCGPPSFMSEFTADLAVWGVATNHLHSETFGSGPSTTPGIAATAPRPPHQPVGPAGMGPLVSFARSNLSVRWAPEFQSLLELAEACDVAVRWSCRTGVCRTCETGLIAGAVDYRPDPLEPPAEGSLLVCCSQPREDVVIDL